MSNPKDSLKNPFECTGYWWLERDPKAVLAGVFRFTPTEGCTLELMGRFAGSPTDRSMDTIRGSSSQGDRLTLLGCVSLNMKLRQGSFEIVHIACAVALVGNFYPNQDLAFSKSAIRFEHIEQWIHSDYVTFKNEPATEIHNFTVETGSRGELESNENFKIYMKGGFTSSSNNQKVNLDAFTSLIIEPNEWRNLEWFTAQTNSLRDLAALSFGLPQPLHSMRLWGDNRTVTEGITEAEVVTVYFWDQPPARQGRGSYPLIMFPRLVNIRPDILNVWPRVRDEYQAVIDLVLIILGGHHTTPEVGFLLAMQAFEAFDRVANPATLTTPEAFKIAYEAMVASIPQGTEEAVKAKLISSIKFANEPSLRQRLKAFHEYLSKALGEEPLGFSKKRIGIIVDTRNFHTHYPIDHKQEILSRTAIVEETNRFCIILIMSVLDRAGVSLSETIRGVDLHERFGPFGVGRREMSRNRSGGVELPTALDGGEQVNEFKRRQ